jgi:putative transposase
LSRRTSSDTQWARIEPLVPGKKGDRGRTGTDTRLFFDAVLWLARTASPWRDLPPELGNRRTAHCRFRRWTLSGVWESLFKTLSVDPDFEYILVDATIGKAHADASGAKGGLRLTQSADRRAA